MAILVIYDVIGFQVTEDNVSAMQVFECQQDLCQVKPSTILSEPFVFLQSTAHVTAGCVIKEQEKFLRGLKSVLESDDEGVMRSSHYITFCLSVLDQVLAEDLLFIQDLHCKVLASTLRFCLRCQNSELLDEIDDTERTLT